MGIGKAIKPFGAKFSTQKKSHAAAESGPDAPMSILPRTPSAPCWQAALDIFERDYQDRYCAFGASVSKVDKSCLQSWNDRFKPTVPGAYEQDPTSHSWQQRVRAYMPFLSPLRAAVMAASAFDPHKIAPIICAVVFSSFEVQLSTPHAAAAAAADLNRLSSDL
jgi:hypothetical protein